MVKYARRSDRTRPSSRLIGIFFGAALLMASVPAYGGAPTAQIQSAVEKVLVVLKDGKLQPEAKRKELREAIYPKFDFAEMARRSLGNHWSRRNAQEQCWPCQPSQVLGTIGGKEQTCQGQRQGHRSRDIEVLTRFQHGRLSVYEKHQYRRQHG